MSLLRDEQGSLSTARCGLWLSILVTLPSIVVDAASRSFNVPTAAYSLLGTIFLAFAGWAGGPRMAQYLFPQIGAAAQGIASGRGDAEPDRFKDDERGP